MMQKPEIKKVESGDFGDFDKFTKRVQNELNKESLEIIEIRKSIFQLRQMSKATIPGIQPSPSNSFDPNAWKKFSGTPE